MATLRASGRGTSDTSTTTVVTEAVMSVTAGDLIVVGVKSEGAATTITVTDTSGNTYTAATTQISHTGNNDLLGQLFYTIATATTTTLTITGTLATAHPFKGIKAYAFAPGAGNSFTLGVVSNSTTNNNGSSWSAGTVTAPVGVSVAFFYLYGTRTLTVGSGWTFESYLNNAGTIMPEHRFVATSGSITGDATTSGGSVDWIGQMATFAEAASGGTSYTLTADTTTYSISGQSATLTKTGVNNYTLPADQGSYTITGSDALVDYTFNASQGSYSFTGQAANLVYTPAAGTTYTLVADQGSYAISGQVATANYTMAANFGTYAISGVAANLTYVGAAINTTLVANQGSYSLNGFPANLVWSGAPVVQGGAQRRRLGIKLSIGF